MIIVSVVQIQKENIMSELQTHLQRRRARISLSSTTVPTTSRTGEILTMNKIPPPESKKSNDLPSGKPPRQTQGKENVEAKLVCCIFPPFPGDW